MILSNLTKLNGNNIKSKVSPLAPLPIKHLDEIRAKNSLLLPFSEAQQLLKCNFQSRGKEEKGKAGERAWRKIVIA